MIWEIKAYTFDLPKTRSQRLKAEVRQKQLDFFVDMYIKDHGKPAMVSVHELGDLHLPEDIPIQERRNTTPEHVFIWKEMPNERLSRTDNEAHSRVVE